MQFSWSIPSRGKRNGSFIMQRFIITLFAVVFLVPAMSAFAQVKRQVQPVGPGFAEDFGILNDEVLVPTEDGGPPVPGEGLSEEQQTQQKAQQMLRMYMQMPYLRQPAMALDAMAERAAPMVDKPAEADEDPELNAGMDPEMIAMQKDAQAFRVDVQAGAWDSVREQLSGMPEKVGPQVYRHMLQMLIQKNAVLLPHDVLGLADASPNELNDELLQSLGVLLQRSVAQTGTPKTMLGQLQQGTLRLGGQEPEKQVKAARLLLKAGLVIEARPYFPPLESAEEGNTAELYNLHALYLQTKGKQEDDNGATLGAWDLTMKVLDLEDIEAEYRDEALNRALDILLEVPDAAGTAWLSKLYKKDLAGGLKMFARVAQRLEAMQRSPLTDERTRLLKVQYRLATELLVAAEEIDQWTEALNMLTLSWLDEADHTVSQGNNAGASLNSNRMGIDPFGNPIYNAPGMRRNNIPPVPASDLLPTAPTDGWLAAISPDLSRKVQHQTGLVASAAGDQDRVYDIIKLLAVSEPTLANELTTSFINAWTQNIQNEGRQDDFYDPYMARSMSFGMSGMYPGSYYNPGRNQGIPLTRAKQARNLEKLRELIDDLESLELGQLDHNALVNAFSVCHSYAEVYRVEDIEAVFGQVQTVDPKITNTLVNNMRSKLARQWRSAQVQEKAGTKRTDTEIAAEVQRGYDLAIDLIDKAVEQNPDNWELVTTQATCYFDMAEFLYGQEVELATYIGLRDKSFAGYKRAAGLYQQAMANVAEGEEFQRTPAIFLQWFQSAMGASDLSFLTRQDAPDFDQVEVIKQTVYELPENEVEHHIALFGEALVNSMRGLNPELKPRYLRSGIRIVGDHESAEKARELLAYYDDLLREIGLKVSIDGFQDTSRMADDTNVGHNRRFGLTLELYHTVVLGREAGGFGKYLMDNYYYYNGARVDMRQRLEDKIREAMKDGFEVESVQFHEPTTTPRGYGRPGWQEYPLCYVVLKVTDPAVDRIPPIAMDLDFNDGMGTVMLPVQSQVIPIDARSDDPPARPTKDVVVTQTLDDRNLDEGILRLEVVAAGKGIMPELHQLVVMPEDPTELSGFEVTNFQSHGLNLKGFDKEDPQTPILTDRTWTIEMEVTPKAAAEGEFTFASGDDTAQTVEYKRYADADIEDVSRTVALAEIPFSVYSTLIMIGIVVILALIAAAIGVYLFIKRRSPDAEHQPLYHRPHQVTPFTVVAMLHRMSNDNRLALSSSQRGELATDIDSLESRYFASRDNPQADGDLKSVVDRWLQKVDGNGTTP